MAFAIPGVGDNEFDPIGTDVARGLVEEVVFRGYLIFRSGYLPKFLGVLLGVAGIGFVIRNFLLVLAPQYASSLFLLPVALAGLSLTVWFLAKGVDVRRWEERAAAVR